MTNQPIRCPWCGDDPLYQAYHDNEWGKPCFDDKALFALLCLESMQAGLSWITVLKKRARFHTVFYDFDPDIVSQFDEAKVNELMQDTGIIRNRAKINAVIGNAKAYLQITQTQSFCDYLWAMSPNGLSKTPKDNHPDTLQDIPVTSLHATQMAKQLKKDGFKFLGATTCYAFMQASGMINDHLRTCTFR